ERATFFSAVEVNEGEEAGALLDPAAGHGGGGGAEDKLPGVIPLPQSPALAAAQVDGREDEPRAVLPSGESVSNAESPNFSGILGDGGAIASPADRAVEGVRPPRTS